MSGWQIVALAFVLAVWVGLPVSWWFDRRERKQGEGDE